MSALSSLLSSFSNVRAILVKFITITAACLGFQNIAYAQLTDSDEFLKAVEDREGTEATKYIDQGLINTKNRFSGQTALHIVVERRDTQWLTFLLQKKARPDVRDGDGISPLLRAVELNFIDGVEKLLAYKADVNYANRSGETPLIKAVLLDRAELVRILLDAGADPDKTDIIQGLSAREYAKRDPRAGRILTIIENFEADKKAKADENKDSGNTLDFSGLTGPTLE